MTGNKYQTEEPKGVDFAIFKLQNFLFNALNWENVELFGRVDKVPNGEEKTALKPYAYYSGTDYNPVVRDDKFAANIFFVLADRANTQQGISFTVEAKIVFMVDLDRLYPNAAGRADHLAQMDVVKALKGQTNFLVTSLGNGLRECLGEFDTEDIKFTNMAPNHIFCITGNLSYQISC